MNCKICEQSLAPKPVGFGTIATDAKPDAESLESGICGECRRRLGIVPLPAPRRRSAPCARCSCMRFVRIVPRQYPKPNEVTVDPREKVLAPKVVLETYICTECGAVETYCEDPTSIPIGPEYMTDVVDYST